MHRTLRSSLLIAMLCLSTSLLAQRPIDPYGEIGITGGYSYYIGDLNPYKHLGPRKKFAFGFLYRLNLTKRHALRMHIKRLHIEAFDSDSNDPVMVNRNLNFRNKMTEGALLLEINFHEYRLGKLGQGFTPYVFGGLAYYNMNPEAEYEGSYFELADMSTEGQGAEGYEKPYSKGQFAIPFGFGFKAGFTKRLAINLEWGMRRTFTDYLDDVSGYYADPLDIRNHTGQQLAADLADQSLESTGRDGQNKGTLRGDPENRDWYVYTGIILSVRLGKDSNGCWK